MTLTSLRGTEVFLGSLYKAVPVTLPVAVRLSPWSPVLTRRDSVGLQRCGLLAPRGAGHSPITGAHLAPGSSTPRCPPGAPPFTPVAELEPRCCAGCPRHRLTPFLLAWGAAQAAEGLGQLLHSQSASARGLPEQDRRLGGLPKRHSPSHSSGG